MCFVAGQVPLNLSFLLIDIWNQLKSTLMLGQGSECSLKEKNVQRRGAKPCEHLALFTVQFSFQVPEFANYWMHVAVPGTIACIGKVPLLPWLVHAFNRNCKGGSKFIIWYTPFAFSLCSPNLFVLSKGLRDLKAQSLAMKMWITFDGPFQNGEILRWKSLLMLLKTLSGLLDLFK